MYNSVSATVAPDAMMMEVSTLVVFVLTSGVDVLSLAGSPIHHRTVEAVLAIHRFRQEALHLQYRYKYGVGVHANFASSSIIETGEVVVSL